MVLSAEEEKWLFGAGRYFVGNLRRVYMGASGACTRQGAGGHGRAYADSRFVCRGDGVCAKRGLRPAWRAARTACARAGVSGKSKEGSLPLIWSKICRGRKTTGRRSVPGRSDRQCCFLGLEDTFERAKERLLRSMQDFLESYHDDGCCMEGVLYWGYGFGYFCFLPHLCASTATARLIYSKTKRCVGLPPSGRRRFYMTI